MATRIYFFAGPLYTTVLRLRKALEALELTWALFLAGSFYDVELVEGPPDEIMDQQTPGRWNAFDRKCRKSTATY